MISKEYEKYLRSAAWSEKRTARLRIDHGRCAICGSGQDLVTLCRPCSID